MHELPVHPSIAGKKKKGDTAMRHVVKKRVVGCIGLCIGFLIGFLMAEAALIMIQYVIDTMPY